MVNPGTNLQARIKVIRWIIPIGLLILAVGYQFGPARWMHDNIGDDAHFLIEILFYGLVGPSIVYLAFNQIQQWLLEKDRAENIARTTQLKLASITEASADAIIGLTPDGIIESWNRGAEQLLGYYKNEIVELPFSSLIGEKESSHVEWDWLSDTVQKSGFIRGYETNFRRANDDLVTVELTATHMTDEQGVPTGYSMILRDITERKNREAEIHQLNTQLNDLVQARTQELDEKVDELAIANEQLKKLDETRSEFVSLVSHQIRAPLTNIRGAVEKMQLDRLEISDDSFRLLSIIDQQAERLNRLVRDVLNANQIETGQLILQKEPLSILPLIEQSVEQLHSRSQKQINIPVKPGLPMVFSDFDRVMEVMMNLLDNAAKYSPPESEIHIDAHANQSEITVSIRDYGEGITAQELPKIFKKFYRSDSSDSQKVYGYGLGLYICRRLVEAMGGKIWAENHPSGGAIFSFTLPIWQELNE
jgi:PAS domain S-box-containing protein